MSIVKETGRVLKNYNGYYYVGVENRIIACKLRGRLKKTRFSLLTGDKVIFTPASNGEGSIEEILPRKNSLLRPAVANVDQLVLVFSVKQPELNLGIVDRFLVFAEQAGVPIIICLTKVDLLECVEDILPIKALYEQIGYQVLLTSTLEDVCLTELKLALAGKTTVFSGLSGVGKSTLLNGLFPQLDLATGQVSEKSERGRHTTRFSQLIPVEQGYIIDTPGFSLNEMTMLSEQAVKEAFKEFAGYGLTCKFSTCSHIAEPDCSVKAALPEGKINQGRYEHYQEIIQEIRSAKGRRS